MKIKTTYELLSGEKNLFFTDTDQLRNQTTIVIAGYKFCIEDFFQENPEGLSMVRKISGKSCGSLLPAQGIRFDSELPIKIPELCQWRFCIPSIYYTKPAKLTDRLMFTYMEDRLTANMVVAFNVDTRETYCLKKLTQAKVTERPIREKKSTSYLHKTENGYVGIHIPEKEKLNFVFGWPYCEKDKSAALSMKEEPVSAFYPMDGSDIDITLHYIFSKKMEDSFTEAVYGN